MSLPFDRALDYANRVYLANRREFDAVILPPEIPAKHFNQHPGKVFREPKAKWMPRCSLCEGSGRIWSATEHTFIVCPTCSG